ncbi:MAG TPA: NAD(P)-binding domain-containing protein [Polyangiales bacterium]
MSTSVILIGLVGVAVLLYVLWERSDRAREAAAVQVVQDIASIGEDLIARSLHPWVDPNKCMGSGACVRACPEHDILGLVGGFAKLVNPLGCIGHGACEAACPVGAIKLVYGTRTRGLELPRVDPYFQTNRRGVYIVGELGGMGLIRNAVAQGKQAAEHVITGSKDQPPRRGQGGVLDAVVVGAGPAGISATLRLMEAGLSVQLLERESFGGTILHYPRAKVVMTGALEIPLYGSVASRTMSKEDLVELWSDIRAKVNPPVVTGALVERLELGADDLWTVRTATSAVRAASVVLALGVRGSPKTLDVPGEELSKVAYRLLEPAEFAGKHVLVVGGGNSAVETALSLADFEGCASITISYRREHFARCRASNRTRIEAAIAGGLVTALLPSELKSISPTEVTLQTSDGTRTLRNDAVIVQIGGTSPSQLLHSFGIEIVTKYGHA